MQKISKGKISKREKEKEKEIKIEIETESKIEGKGFHASGALPPEILSAGCLPKGVCERGKWVECVF